MLFHPQRFLFKFILLITLLSAAFVNADSLQVSNPTSGSTSSTEMYMSRRILMDSLFALQLRSSRTEETYRTLLNDGKIKIEQLEQQQRAQVEEIKKLTSELEVAKGDSLQSSHTSSVLFIFNIVVAIILLIALLWMFSNKKKIEKSPRTINSTISTESLEYRLDRIEKLGSLKEKGLLTEEEFSVQKKQILAERN
jgi:competence protein ComGC